MKQKKSLLIIVVSVVAVCLLGVIASQVFDWPVNADQTSGNVAKSSRFSRKTAQEAASNMQELLLSDEGYKNGLVAAYEDPCPAVRCPGRYVGRSGRRHPRVRVRT